jgi:hypothetical protein
MMKSEVKTMVNVKKSDSLDPSWITVLLMVLGTVMLILGITQ